MKKHTHYLPLLLFSIMLLALACHKEPVVVPPTPPPTPTSKLNIVWQTPILSDTSRHSFISPRVLVDGGIAFSTNLTLPTAFIQMRDADSGIFRWKFDNLIIPAATLFRDQITGVNNKVIINQQHSTYCLDANSGNLDWSIDVSAEGYGEPSIISFGDDYVYKANFTGGKPKVISESIVRAHYLLGVWDTLFTIMAEGSFYLNIQPPTLWINPQGDSVLIIRDNGRRDKYATSHEGRYNLVNLYAWNMRTRQYDWQVKDFQDERLISFEQPIVDDNRLYIHGYRMLYCINLLNGSLIWKKEFAHDIFFENIVQHKNFVIIQDDYHEIWALHKSDGSQAWHNNTTNETAVNMNYFDGVVYFIGSSGNGLLYAINAQTGATIWAEYPPTDKPDATFGLSDIVIDPVRRLLYTADGYYLMCIKLPE